jgi:hypothetical protein
VAPAERSSDLASSELLRVVTLLSSTAPRIISAGERCG